MGDFIYKTGMQVSYKRRNSYFFKIPPKMSYFSYPLNVSPEPSKMAPSNPKMPKISPGFAPGPHWGAYSAPSC